MSKDPDTPEWAEQMQKLSDDADGLTSDNLKAHYVCAMANWGYVLDEVEMLRAHVAALEKALAAKIGPDWREALPYESELELVSVIKAKNALVGRLEKVVEAARAYITVIGPDDAELDVLVDALADLDATR